MWFRVKGRTLPRARGAGRRVVVVLSSSLLTHFCLTDLTQLILVSSSALAMAQPNQAEVTSQNYPSQPSGIDEAVSISSEECEITAVVPASNAESQANDYA